MLQSTLGVQVDATKGVVEVNDPMLPTGIERLTVSNLQVGDAKVDLAFQRLDGHTVVMPRNRTGDVAVRSVR